MKYTRNIIVLFILFISLPEILYAQNLSVSGKLLINRQTNSDVKILLFQKNNKIDSTYSNENGFFEINIPYNSIYTLRFEKFGQVPKTILLDTKISVEMAKKEFSVDLFLNFENAPVGLDLSTLKDAMAKISYSGNSKRFIYNENFFMPKKEYDKLLQTKINQQKEKISTIQQEIRNLSPEARKSLGIDIKEYELKRKISYLKLKTQNQYYRAQKESKMLVKKAQLRAKEILLASTDSVKRKNVKDTSSIAQQRENLQNQKYILEIERLNAKTHTDSLLIFKREAEIAKKEGELNNKEILIKKQREVVVLQKDKLKSRNQLLFLLAVILFLVTGGLIYIFRLNRRVLSLNQELWRTNDLLEHHSIALSETKNAVVIVDLNMTIVWNNKAFFKILGNKGIIEPQKNLGEIINLDLFELANRNDKKEEIIKLDEENDIWFQISISKIKLKNYEEQYIVILTNVSDLEKARIEIENQEDILRKQNKKITDSIRYAKRIQNSILITESKISPKLEPFIVFHPKDIVSGDFYFYKQLSENKFVIAAADCTGHGVPGAFISLASYEKMEQILYNSNIKTPADLLVELDGVLTQFLTQGDSGSDDGLEIALCFVEKKENKWHINFSGAGLPLLYFDFADNSLKEIKGQSIGIAGDKKYYVDKTYKNNEIIIENDIRIYLYSDGMVDQRNKEGKRLGTKKFLNILNNLAKKSTEKQKNEIENIIFAMNESSEQRDDITLISIKLVLDE